MNQKGEAKTVTNRTGLVQIVLLDAMFMGSFLTPWLDSVTENWHYIRFSQGLIGQCYVLIISQLQAIFNFFRHIFPLHPHFGRVLLSKLIKYARPVAEKCLFG